MRKQILTLCLVYEHPRILLAMKKEGFGAGYYNGFGGKVEEGESIDACARRELFDESKLTAGKLKKIGILEFEFEEKPNKFDSLEVHVHQIIDYTGEPKETDEMRPEWFDVSDIPYYKMWEADTKWLPIFLDGKKFKGKFYYNNAKDRKLLSYGIDAVDRLE